MGNSVIHISINAKQNHPYPCPETPYHYLKYMTLFSLPKPFSVTVQTLHPSFFVSDYCWKGKERATQITQLLTTEKVTDISGK